MKDDFINLETEKVRKENTNGSKATSVLIDDFINEYDVIGSVLRKNRTKISKAINIFTKVFTNGGSIYFIGAGTSGRLGVLESAECPPTFGTDSKRIVGIMAGGRAAVFKSKEGAEDSRVNSSKDLKAKNYSKNDLLIAISASGKSEYVLSAVKFARKVKSKTILITCNKLEKNISDLDIVLNVGPEVVAGSTRLKSGTATKNILNIITTVSMMKLEKIYRNMMIDISPTTRKLKARSIRNLCNILNISQKKSVLMLEKSKWSIRIALIMSKMNLSYNKAKDLSSKISISEMLDGK